MKSKDIYPDLFVFTTDYGNKLIRSSKEHGPYKVLGILKSGLVALEGYVKPVSISSCVAIEDWQPIETAPKDGSKILLLKNCEYLRGKSFVPCVGWWDKNVRGFHNDLDGGWVSGDADDEGDWKVDFWMNIPKPQYPPAPNGLPYSSEFD